MKRGFVAVAAVCLLVACVLGGCSNEMPQPDYSTRTYSVTFEITGTGNVARSVHIDTDNVDIRLASVDLPYTRTFPVEVSNMGPSSCHFAARNNVVSSTMILRIYRDDVVVNEESIVSTVAGMGDLLSITGYIYY